MQKSVFDHLALLTDDLERDLETIKKLGYPISDISDFPDEGTREVYIGPEKQLGRLLMLQPIADGPYQRAMEKRGNGIHHLAINVENLEDYLLQISDSGWLLHPQTIATMKYGTAWLARPGFPTLIEVHQRKAAPTESFFIEEVQLGQVFQNEKLITALNCPHLTQGNCPKMNLRINGKNEDAAELFSFLK